MSRLSIKRVVSACISRVRQAFSPEPAIGTLKRWSVASDWTGGKPVAGQNVVLSGNWLLDEQTPSLGSLTISGYMRDDPAATNIGITAGNISITSTGMLRIGSFFSRRAYKTILTFTGAEVGRATRYVADRTATSGAGNGKLKRLSASAGAVTETITVTFTSPTAFSVSGTVSGSNFATGTVGVLFDNKVRFIATAGTVAWAAGHTQTIKVASQAFVNNGVGRSLQVQPGGRLKLFGRIKTGATKLAASMADGATSATVLDATGWEVGDEIVIGPTDFADTTSGVAAKRTITSIVGNTISWADPVVGSRWGVLQYATDAGLSLTPGTLTKPSDWTQEEWDGTPKVLDQRARVINLTRDIVLQGADDTAWQTNKFGLHTMFMGLESEIELDGVEYCRVGQAGAIGRYPVHWHVVSYNMPDSMILPSDGQMLGLASGQYIANCSIHTSGQRMTTLHGTCGVRVENNVGYDITGHGIFFEESSEMYNRVVGNTIIKVTTPTTANRLNDSEAAPVVGGAAGIWMTNPANTLTDNEVFGARIGIWNAFSSRCFNLTQEVPVSPQSTRVFEHARNVGACCTARGLFTEQPPLDNFGRSTDPVTFNGKNENGIRFEFRGNQVWKNQGSGYGNRVNPAGSYVGWVAADNEMLDFAGQAGHDVTLHRALLVGVSLNNGNNAETRAVNNRRACFVSYDEGLVVRNILAFNYTLREPPTLTRNVYGGQTVSSVQGGGLVRMGEYLFPVWTFTEYGKWKLVNCNPGYMGTPPNIDGLTVTKGSSFTLGICRDVNGLFTGTPGKHVVWNDPFYTYGAANLANYTHPAAKVTDTVYMGLAANVVSGVSEGGIWDASQYKYLGAFYVDRLDPTGTIVVGSWNIRSSTGAGDGGQNLDWFKHCACARGGVYRLGFNGLLPSTSLNGTGQKFVVLKLSMMRTSDDIYTLAVAWPGDTPVGMVYQRWRQEGETTGLSNYELVNSFGTPLRPLGIKLNNTGMTSKADVIADTTGLKYWQDTANNLVWIKVKGDLVYDEALKLGTGKLDPNRNICLGIRTNVVS